MKRKILIPLLFAFVLSVLLIIVIPLDFSKYEIEKRSVINHLDVESISFADLNGDGIDDFIECGGILSQVRRSGCACRMMNEKSITGTIDQINVPNLIYSNKQATISDFNKDGVAEIWLPSGEDGQLYLYGFDADNLGSYKYRFWLDSIYPQGEKYVVGFNLQQSHDVNGDGFDELYFHISNRHPVYPRRIYRVDVINEEIKRSPATSAGFSVQHSSKTRRESIIFTSSTTSPGNHKDSLNLPYPDTLGFIYAFDQDLQFLFEPIPFCVYPSGASNFFSASSLVSIQTHRTPDSSALAQVRSLNGDLIRELRFESVRSIEQISEKNFVLTSMGKILLLDSLLKEQKTIYPTYPTRSIRPYDLDGDGNKELFGDTYSNGSYLVYDNNLEHVTEFTNETGNSFDLHIRQYAPNSTEFVLFGKGNLIFYRYFENPYYYFQIPYYLLVFLIALIFSSRAFRYYRKSIEKRFDQEREFNRLQILSLKNQIDPHFALNTLNSVDWMYKSGQPEKATRYMETYSRLMHQTVTSSDKVSVSLYDELNFCRKYCELEKLREPEFDYSISVDENIDSFEINVPRQIVFTHVENAIKHGLRPKDGEKILKIMVDQSETETHITVENNGVPYKEKLKTSGTGKGLEILKEMSNLYTALTKKKIESRVESKENNSGSIATVVIES